MSLSKVVVATAQASTALVAMCGSPSTDSTDPTPVVASYTCDSAFDTGCRWTADVTVTSGTLTSADIGSSAGETWTEGAFDSLTGMVTVSDAHGELGAVTCDFTVDLTIQTETLGTDALVDVSRDVVFDAACPLDCGWFLPGTGTFDTNTGRSRLLMVEGRWELELGDFPTPDDAPNSPLWLWTEPASNSFDGTSMSLDAPVAVAGGTWTAPLPLSANGFADPTCD